MASLQDRAALYEEIQQKLASANASIEAAEVHGVLCGLAATGQDLPYDWFDELFDQAEPGDVLADEAKSIVRELFNFASDQVASDNVSIQLLLPTDDVSLPLRARAMSEWSQGFLYGVGLSGELVTLLGEEARECLEDITELTRLDLNAIGEMDDQQEEEQALMELTEFLRVAILLVHEDIKSLNNSAGDAGQHDYH
jgi:yecA family protein